MIVNDDDPDDLREHVRAISLRRDALVGEAEALTAETWRRLEAAGMTRSTVDAIARSLGSPPRHVPFAVIFAALADGLEAQAATARALATEWGAWDARVSDLEDEGHARALALAPEGTPC
jgi:hypothetical protein